MSFHLKPIDRKITFYYFLLGVFTLVLFSPTLTYPFVWDDYVFIIKKEHIQNFTPFSKFFLDLDVLRTFPDENIYRPLRSLVFASLYHFFELNPFFYHAWNIILHIACSLLFLGFLRSFKIKDSLAFFGALVFAVHPIHTEAVTWICGGADPLVTVSFLLALMLFLRDGGWFKMIAVGLVFPVCLISKELAVTWPVVMFLLHFVHPKLKGRLKNNAAWLLVSCLLVIAYLGLRFYVLKSFSQDPFSWSALPAAIMRVPVIILIYVKLIIFPYPQNAFWPRLPTFGLAPIIVSWLVMLGVYFYLWKKKLGLVALMLLLFVLTLGPVLNILPLWVDIAERFVYLPSVFFIAALTLALANIKYLDSNVFKVGALVLVLLFSLLTLNRNPVWSDNLRLAQDSARKSPDHAAAQYNLGLAASQASEWKTAISALEKYHTVAPPNCDVFILLGAAYRAVGEFDDATAALSECLLMAPHIYEARVELGITYSLDDKPDLAVRQFQTAIKTHPELKRAKLELIKTMLRAGAEAEAKKAWKLFLNQHDPGNLQLDDLRPE